ncbi:MAG TPA: GNAT family N-acetyltransferase [Candidatus Nanopelagicales bacterium]
MLEVRVAQLAEVRPLQLAVLRPNGPLPGDAPPPAEALHVGAFDDGEAVGAASVMPAPWPGPGSLPEPAWQLRSMAVRGDRRGSGVGSHVLRLAEDTAAGQGAVALWAAARLAALRFYQRAGWTPVGELWVKPGIGPHRYVTLRLATAAPWLRRLTLD